MKALIFQGPNRVELGEQEEPKLTTGQVLLEVAACGICGTDLHVYRGLPASWPVPGVRGHEITGKVLAWANDVQGFDIGDRVVVQPLIFCGKCNACISGRTNLCYNTRLVGGEYQGGFAERVAVPAQSLFKLPDNLTLEHATLTETLATPVHAFQQNISGLLRSVAILGAGPQGLLSLQISKRLGVKLIAISDVVPHRLMVAESLGATLTINANKTDPVKDILAMTDGEGVDLVMETAGVSMTRKQAVKVLRPGGTAVFLALGADQTPMNFLTIVPKELKLHGTQCYLDADFARAIVLLEDGDIKADMLITTASLEEGPEMFNKLANDPNDVIKAVLIP